MTWFANIGGVEYGPTGQNVLVGVRCEGASLTRNGSGELKLLFPYAAAYSIVNRMEVQVYETISGTANGLLGGFVVGVESGAIPGTAYKLVTVKVVDYNVLLDAIVRDAADAATLTVSSARFTTQLTNLVQAMQQNGLGSVNKAIDTTTYVVDYMGATALPSFTVKGESLRQALRKISASVTALHASYRPRFALDLRSDGAGGVQCCLVAWNGSAPTSSIATFSYAPSGGEKSIKKFARTLDSSMPIVNRRQSVWGAPERFVVTFADSGSGTTYPNPYINHSLTGAKGYWMDLPLEDKDSTTSTDATNKLTRTVTPVLFPRETIAVTYDKPASDLVFIRPGHTLTLKWAPDGITSTDYDVAGVSIDFPTKADVSYETITLTLGLPKLKLFENGLDGEARAPIELGQPSFLPAPAWNSSYTTGVEWSGFWITVSWGAVSGAVGYEVWAANSSGGTLYSVPPNPTGQTSITLRGLPGGVHRYLKVWARDAGGRRGFQSAEKDVQALVRGGPPTAGIDWSFSNPDDALAGYSVVTGSAGDFSIDPAATTTPFEGTASLKIAGAAGATKELKSQQFACTPGTTLVDHVAVMRDAGVGSAPTARVFKRFFAGDGTTQVGADLDIYNATPGTSWPAKATYTPNLVPAGAYLYEYHIREVEAGLSAHNVWFSRPVGEMQIKQPSLFAPQASAADPVQLRDENGDPVECYYWSPATHSWVFGTLTNPTYSDQGFAFVDANGGTLKLRGQVMDYAGAFSLSGVTTKTATFTADTTTFVYLCNSASAFTANLPAAANCGGRIYVFKNINTGKVTIDPNASETIDGITTFPLVEKNQAVAIQSDGTNWQIIVQSGLILESDGTRWLGPVQTLALDSTAAVTSSPADLIKWPVPGDYPIYFVDWASVWKVKTTNNGSNYWTVKIQKSTDDTTFTDVANFDTSAGAANTATKADVTSFSPNPLATSDMTYKIVATSTGAPGNLNVYSLIRFRYVIS